MTRREAAIVSAYTGFLCGSFADLHQYVEEIMGRPVWPHEMASKFVADKIRVRSKADFCALIVEPPC